MDDFDLEHGSTTCGSTKTDCYHLLYSTVNKTAKRKRDSGSDAFVL